MEGKEKSQEHFTCLFDTPRGVRLKLSWQAKFFSGCNLLLTLIRVLTQSIPTRFLKGRV